VTGAKVLVVEDDLDLRGVVLRGLVEEGFAAVGVGSGSELLERIEPEAPDLLIVDIGLPDTDGRDVVQALRAQGKNEDAALVEERFKRAWKDADITLDSSRMGP